MEHIGNHLGQDHPNNESIYPDLDDAFPPTLQWMSSYPPIPVEHFPGSVGPIVYEGYVSDAPEGSGWQGPGTSEFGSLANGDAAQPSVEQTALDDPDFNIAEDGMITDSDDMSVDEHPEREKLRIYPVSHGHPTVEEAGEEGKAEEVGGDEDEGEEEEEEEEEEEGEEEAVTLKGGVAGTEVPGLDRENQSNPAQSLRNSKTKPCAIAINPEMYPAHVLLSEIYFARNEDDKAVAALFTGAHAAPREPDVWHQVADVCLQKTTLDRTRALEQAGYCFSRLLQMNQKDHDSRFQRAAIAREQGNWGRAMSDFDKILHDMPHNPSVLRQIAEICIEINQVGRAKKLYHDCIAHYQQVGIAAEDAFSWSDINVYVELFAHTDDLDQAIAKLKELSRWLLGRADEVYWNDVTNDDREWDGDDAPRRLEEASYVPGRFPLESYGEGLPLELRVKLGSFRLKQDAAHRAEAFGHFEWLEPEDTEPGAKVHDYADLFREVATKLKSVYEHEEALRYFEAVQDVGLFSDVNYWLDIAASSYMCGNRDQALECYEKAKQMDDDCAEARTQLAKLYRDLGDRDKALQNANESVAIARRAFAVTDRRKYERKEQREARIAAERALKEARKLPVPLNGTDPQSRRLAALKAPPRPIAPIANPAVQRTAADRVLYTPRFGMTDRDGKLNALELQLQRTDRVNQLYTTLIDLGPAMRSGDQDAHSTWLDCARELIEDFRSMRVFYPPERHISFKGYDNRYLHAEKLWLKQVVPTPDQVAQHDDTTLDDFSLDPDIPPTSADSAIPDSYRMIPFTSWLDIFLEAALLLALASPSNKEECYTTLTAAQDCTIWYHSPPAMLQIYTCYFACALALHDSNTLTNNVVRWFMRQYRFCTDTYRLFAALNLVFPFPNDSAGKASQMLTATYRLGPSQKFLFRQVKAIDALLPRNYNVDGEEGPVPQFMRDQLGWLTKEEQDENAPVADDNTTMIRPQEMDIVLLTLYGHILYAGGSYPNALSYFYRAYTLDPKNPMVLLSISLSYVHQLFKRQNEDRHMYLLQGLAFFEEYADARIQGAKDGEIEQVVAREVEFNRARIWHLLGMADLAVKGYARVLLQQDLTTAKAGEEQETDTDTVVKENWSMEAAYAIQSLYAMGRDTAMARYVTEKWLVVE